MAALAIDHLQHITAAPSRTRIAHPMNSTAVMLQIMELSRLGEASKNENHPDHLEGVISKRILKDLLTVLHVRDSRLTGHVRRVAQLSVGMAQHLKWDDSARRNLEIAALLHDVGKIGIPDSILNKPGKFNHEETELMALHNDITLDILQACHVSPEVLNIVAKSHALCHGASTGSGSFGHDYHLGARILAVADAYDSLTNNQVFRSALKHEAAVETLKSTTGSQFDNNLINALDRWIKSEGMHFFNSAEIGQPVNPFAPETTDESLAALGLCNVFMYLYTLESLYDGFYLLDPDLRFVVWNQGAERLFGQTSEAMLNNHWSSRLLSLADQYSKPIADNESPMHKVLETGKPAVNQVRVKAEDDSWIDIELQSIPLFDEQGTLVGLCEIFKDLSRAANNNGQYKKLKLQASRDALTNVANRGEMENQLAVLINEYREKPQDKRFSVIFMDVDHFKKINDTYGHDVGDEVLINVARLLEQETYSGELVARYGGEEFVILCPETELEQAKQRAERIRLALKNAKVSKESKLKATASFGLTEIEPGDSLNSVLRRADQGVYISKGGGRNRTTALTSKDVAVMESGAQKDPDEPNKGYEFEGEFDAFVAADMMVYKLGGFVDDHRASLVKVEPGRAVLRLGSNSIFGFFSNDESKQRVQIVIEFGGEHRYSPNPMNSMVRVKVRISPLSWGHSSKHFQKRARNAFKMIKSYFAAH